MNYLNDGAYPDELANEVQNAIKKVESIMDQKFGDPEKPAVSFDTIGRKAINAWNDGNCFKCRLDG